MARKRYTISYRDMAYPEIILADPDDKFATGFTEAKNTLIKNARSQIDHLRYLIANARSLKASDVGKDD